MTKRMLRKLNVLVVDDDPAIVRLLSAILKRHFVDEITLVAMTDPNEASHWLETHCCDILLSDIEMPGLDGLKLLQIAKSQNAWTQVIILTAHSTWDRLHEALQNGASDYLLKPMDLAEVLEVVAQRLEQAGRWQRAARDTLSPPEPAGASA